MSSLSERMLTTSSRRGQQVHNVNGTQRRQRTGQTPWVSGSPMINVGAIEDDDDDDDDDDDTSEDEDDDDDVVELTASEFDRAKRHKSGGPRGGPLVVDNESGVITRGIKNRSKPVAPVEGPKFHCPICMSPITRAMSTQCGHIFCNRCIRAAIAFQGKCPTCRKQVTAKDLIRVFLPTPK